MQTANLQVKILAEQPLKAEKFTTKLKKKIVKTTRNYENNEQAARSKSEKIQQKETRN